MSNKHQLQTVHTCTCWVWNSCFRAVRSSFLLDQYGMHVKGVKNTKKNNFTTIIRSWSFNGMSWKRLVEPFRKLFTFRKKGMQPKSLHVTWEFQVEIKSQWEIHRNQRKKRKRRKSKIEQRFASCEIENWQSKIVNILLSRKRRHSIIVRKNWWQKNLDPFFHFGHLSIYLCAIVVLSHLFICLFASVKCAI